MNYLALIRKQNGASQQEVADYLGVTRQAYSNYEVSAREPDFETLLKLGEFFDVTVDEILRGPTHLSPQTDNPSDTIKKAPQAGGKSDLSLSLDAMIDMLQNEEGIMFDGMNYSEEAITLLYQSVMNVKETARMLAEMDKGKKNENSEPGPDD